MEFSKVPAVRKFLPESWGRCCVGCGESEWKESMYTTLFCLFTLSQNYLYSFSSVLSLSSFMYLPFLSPHNPGNNKHLWFWFHLCPLFLQPPSIFPGSLPQALMKTIRDMLYHLQNLYSSLLCAYGILLQSLLYPVQSGCHAPKPEGRAWSELHLHKEQSYTSRSQVATEWTFYLSSGASGT